jgi:hypothetical protein
MQEKTGMERSIVMPKQTIVIDYDLDPQAFGFPLISATLQIPAGHTQQIALLLLFL